MKPADANLFNPLLMLQWIRKKYFTIFKTAALLGVLLAAVLLLITSSIPAVGAEVAQAQIETVTEGVQVIEEPLGLTALDIRVVIANIIRAVLGLIGIILVILIMYGGYLYMTAGGNDEQIGKAKAILKNAVIGLAIILAAYSIVLFVMKMLGIQFSEGGPGINQPGTTNFAGSGALGRIVKDHYPMRDQKNVPRNTKIVVTFRKPIKLDDSWIVEKTNDTIFGNCKPVVNDWNTDCDQLKTLSNDYINITQIGSSTAPVPPVAGAVIMAAPSPATADLPAGVYTIVLKPLTDLRETNGGYLGNTIDDVSYSVYLGKNIQLDLPGNPPAFDAVVGNNYYKWQFTCNTTLDLSPPVVVGVYPDKDSFSPRNTVLQIDFNEAIDPTGVQGAFLATSTYFQLTSQNIFLNSNHSTKPEGSFALTNGYRTLEFTPTEKCGENACGRSIYCLPACNASSGDTCNATPPTPPHDIYELLLRAGKVRSTSSFDSMPFSGVMDMVGNAMDSQPYGTVNVAPNTGEVFLNSGTSAWESPDNYFWSFKVTDKIDLTAPYLIRVFPGLNAGGVPVDEPVAMLFSKRMRVDPLYDIEIKEKPEQIPPLCKWPRTDELHVSATINHCPFLNGNRLDGKRQDYFPVITSAVEDVNFNCFYPGKGPKNYAGSDLKSDDCTSTGTCCDVASSTDRAFCCNGLVKDSTNGVNNGVNNCITELYPAL